MTGLGVVKRWPSWLLMAALACLFLTLGATRDRSGSTSVERVRGISSTIKCPICGGESVYESRVPIAGLIREEIARQVAAGSSDGEVRAAVQRAYPEAQILTPPSSGIGAFVWVLPVVLFVLGAAGLTRSFLRWRVR